MNHCIKNDFVTVSVFRHGPERQFLSFDMVQKEEK